LETLREKREELDLQEPSDLNSKQKEKILAEYNQYLEQLKRFD
jgi:hypothetical protein